MTQQPDDYDQDAEPTQKAPEEGRPDGTVAPDRDSDEDQKSDGSSD